MLSQWLGIILCYSEPVVVNDGELCWASGCESWCVILSQWICIMVCNAARVVVNHGFTIIHNHWLSISHHDSQPLAQHNNPWFTTTRAALHTMMHIHWLRITHHERLWIMRVILSQWLWLMVCHTEPVVVNHGLIYWSEWLWVMVCNAETVVVNQGVLFWASGCESWWTMPG
jgi:hypothetical protein